MSETVETERFCLDCKKETIHVLHYADNLLTEGRCTECGSVFRNNVKLLEVYGERLMKRVLTKPLRLAAELKEKPAETILGLPGRAIKKPFKEASRIAHLLEHEESSGNDQTDQEDGTEES